MALKDRLEDDRSANDRTSRNTVQHWRQRLLEEINLDELARLTMAQRRARLEKVVGLLVTREGPVLAAGERANLIRRVVDEALGPACLSRCSPTRASPRSW